MVSIEVQCISWNSYNDIWDFIEFKGFDLVYMFKVFENSAFIVLNSVGRGPTKKRLYDPLNANCSLNV